MKHITLNGINLIVCPKAELRRAGGYNGCPHQDGLYLVGLDSKHDYLKASGVDEREIDYALPQDWLERQYGYADSRHIDALSFFVWSYINGHGEPLDIRTLLPDIFKVVITKLQE